MTPCEAACNFLKSGQASASYTLSGVYVQPCIARPPLVPQNGDLIFDSFTLACKAVVQFPETPFPSCYAPATRKPGVVDRSTIKVKICFRYWLSQRLTSTLVGVMMKDFLGYNVVNVDMSSSSTSMVWENMEAGACQVEVESWQADKSSPKYMD